MSLSSEHKEIRKALLQSAKQECVFTGLRIAQNLQYLVLRKLVTDGSEETTSDISGSKPSHSPRWSTSSSWLMS